MAQGMGDILKMLVRGVRMAIEQYTESLTLREMKCVLGNNGWGFVFRKATFQLLIK